MEGRAAMHHTTKSDLEVEVNTAGASIDAHLLIDVFSRHARRWVEGIAATPTSEWERPTRCAEWSFRDLVHHLVTVTERAARILDPRTGPDDRTFGEIDPRITPDEWIRADGVVGPRRLLVSLEEAVGDLARSVGALARSGTEFDVHTPIGLRPWPMLVLHGLWDSWVHQRDAGWCFSNDDTGVVHELRLAAAYALFLTGTTAASYGYNLSLTIDTDQAGGRWHVRVGPDVTAAVESIARRPTEPAELVARCASAELVDSLSGRGAPLEDLLDGNASAAAPLKLVGLYFNGRL